MDKLLAHQPGQVNSIKQQKFQNKGRGQSENKGKKGGQTHKHRSPRQFNHRSVTISIVLATLQGILAVRQEINSVVNAGHVDTFWSVVGGRELQKH